jgi:hypothetical protein
MSTFPKVKISMILILAILSTACSFSPSIASSQKVPSTVEKKMTSETDNFIKNVTLIAREEKRPPLGIPQNPNRDIGFASIFLRIENPTEENANILIINIEIRNAFDERLQSFSQSPQEISLKPLENSEMVFNLTNKTGYSGQEKVKAVVTYQVGKKVNLIESEAVEVSRR